MPTSITTGASYYMSVIDEASRWSLIFFLEHKDDATLAMEQANGKEGVMAWALTQLPLRVELTPSSTGAR